MIQYRQEFKTEADAEAYISQVYAAYHPCGYGTRLEVTKLTDDRWLVTGYRYASCD